MLPFNWYATNIGTALSDAYAIGKIIYKDRFSDIDPEQAEMFSQLQGNALFNLNSPYLRFLHYLRKGSTV